MRSRWTLLSLLLVATPALATWFPFSEPRRTGPAAYDQAAPVVASNGIDYLVAWTTVSFSHVYAARVGADGSVAGEIGTMLDSDSQFAHGVSLTPGRDGYFAAWMSEKGMTAAMLDSYGRVEQRVTVPQDDPYHSARTIAAWSGYAHLVVSGFVGPFTATVFDIGGNVIVSNIPIGDTHGEQTSVAMVADTAGFLVLSTKREFSGGGYRDAIYGRYISPTGTTGDWFLIRSVASAVSGLAVVADGSRDVIAWSDQFGLWTMDFDPQTNTAGTSRQLSPVSGATLTRILRFDGRLWLVWTTLEQNDFAMRLGSDGSPGTPVAIGSGYRPEIAANGSSILSVRSAHTGTTFVNDVFGRFVSATSSDFLVSKSETDQQNGELASGGSTVVAVWDEEIGSNREIFAARFDASGRALDGAGVQISSGGVNQKPAVAFNGHDWLVVWNHAANSSTLVGRRFSAAGTVIDSEDIVLGPTSYTAPRATSDGSSWLVGWIAPGEGPACGNVGGAARAVVSRVSADGVVLDPGGRAIAAQIPMDQSEIDLGWNGSSYVAAWTNVCVRWHQPSLTSISGALVAPDLSRFDVVPLSGAPTTIAPVAKPVVAADGEGSLVAWQRTTASGAVTDYQIVDQTSAPRRVRSRAVGAPRVVQSVEGTLIGASRSRTGEFMVFVRKTIPWTAGYDGIFFSLIGRDGSIVGSGLSGTLDADEMLMGHVVRGAGFAVIPEGRFDAPAGAQRLWLRTVD